MKAQATRFTVIGAGNGGKAMAAHLALMGHAVTLYNRTPNTSNSTCQATPKTGTRSTCVCPRNRRITVAQWDRTDFTKYRRKE